MSAKDARSARRKKRRAKSISVYDPKTGTSKVIAPEPRARRAKASPAKSAKDAAPKKRRRTGGKPWAKGESGNKAGRKPGTPNKITRTVKEAMIAAYEELGGVDGMVSWARGNRGDFYKLYARLIPYEVTGSGGGPLQFQKVVREIVRPGEVQDSDGDDA